MAHTIENFASSIVAVGAFNPTIFSPDWFFRNNLIGEGDVEATHREDNQIIVSQQVTVFQTDVFALQVVPNQFIVQSKGTVSPSLPDVFLGTFSLLSHTPVTAMGLNFMAHVRLESMEDYYKIGDVLAPKAIWKELFPREDELPGLLDLTVTIQHGQRDRAPSDTDQVRITVQPSSMIRGGVFLNYNGHHEITKDARENRSSAELAAQYARDHWHESCAEAQTIFNALIERALKAAT